MGFMSALDISSSALGVHQSCIDIVSNNIANMNTEGYSKQRANLGTNILGLNIGENVYNQVKTSCGVELINVQRYTTSFLGSYYQEQLSKEANLNTQADQLNSIASLFDDLQGQGLDTSLTEFYEALDNLNQYPTDMSARVNVLEKSEALTYSMNSIYKNLNGMKTEQLGDGSSLESLKNTSFYASLSTVNSYLEDLANINNMLAKSQTGSLENNNLLDKRDTLLNNLAQYADFDTTYNENGTVSLSLDGIALVKSSKVVGAFDAQTAKEYDNYCTEQGITNTNTSNAVLMIKTESGTIQNANGHVNSGQWGALVNPDTTSETNIDNIIGNLNTLASTIADVFNNLQTRQGAFYLDYSTGKAQLSNTDLSSYSIFTTNDGSSTVTAGNISVNSLLTTGDGYNKIAAAYVANYDPLDPTSYDADAVGNANNIIAMINTQTDASGSDFEPLGHLTFGNYYNGLLTKISSGMSKVQNEADIQSSVVDSIESKAAEETSVDLNEELTELVKSQTAYSASAKVFSTCNELLDTLIALGE